MGKYIVLEIDDDECAQTVLDNPPQGAVPIAMYHKASKFCECPDIKAKDGYVAPGQFVRGTKFGMFVHKVCKKPRAGHLHYLRNMLTPELIGYGDNILFQMRQPYTQYYKYGKR